METDNRPDPPQVALDVIGAAAGFVRANWGDYGYAIGTLDGYGGGGTFRVTHSDGSRFNVISDRYGNVREDPREVTW